MSTREIGPAQRAWNKRRANQKFDDAFRALHDAIRDVKVSGVDDRLVIVLFDKLAEIESGFRMMASRPTDNA